MTNRQLARIHRALRIRLKLRQADVAAKARIGRWKVVKIEAAELGDLSIDEVRSSFEALGARLDLVAAYHGAALDRLLDEVHAQLVGGVVAALRSLGWTTEIEVSFAIYADRGSIDILAWHPEEQALLVVEIKSELGALDGLLRPLDVKVRHAAAIARQRFGWRARTISRLVVLPENTTSRRVVVRHSAVLDRALPLRSRQIRRWLRSPVGAVAGIWFLSDDGHADTKPNPSSIRRVRRGNSPPIAPESRLRPDLEIPDRDAIRLIDSHRVGIADI